MRIIWLFILFGTGILGDVAFAAEIYESGPSIHSEDSDPMNIRKIVSSTTVNAYAGAAYTFGEGSLWSGTSSAAGSPDGNGALSFIFPQDSSRYLYARNFNFNIPCNAIIESVTIRVTRQNRSTTDAIDTGISLFNPIRLAKSPVSLTDPNIWDEAAWETITYSHINWGENLTPELINNNRFGVLIEAENPLTAGRAEPMVDAVEMEVCYAVTGPPSTPIFFTVEKVDACYNEGSITINATGGSGIYEYSINNGGSWQNSNSFSGLSSGDYTILVRNSDATCQTIPVHCNLSGDERILQPGDAVLTCATFPGNRVTLAVEKLQIMNELYNAGEVGYDISTLIAGHSYEYDIDDFGGEVFSTAIDPDRNIYTVTSILYDLTPGGAIPVNVSRIDALSGAVSLLTTLPGDAGGGAVDYNTECNELYVSNLSNGTIYRIDPVFGTTLGTYDPGAPDNGAAGMAPLGERVLSLTYNPNDNRLYYALWNSDYDQSGIRNTIRSIAIDPVSCDFLPATDQLEITLPWTSEYGDTGNLFDFSMPVADMQFSQDGTTLILAESGFDSSVPTTKPHNSRVMRYTGSSMSWTLQTALPPGNTNMQYEFGEVSAGLNARGGVAFANSGFDGANCSLDLEEFIIGTADALRGADCNTLGCIYGLQYSPVGGAKSPNSVLLDVARDLDSQQKSVFGDIDMVEGCFLPLFCCPELVSDAPDVTICPGDVVPTMTVTTQADSLALVYHTSIPQDSAAVYTDGTPLDTVEVIGGVGVLSLADLDVSSPTTYYVYAINHPTSDLIYCRPYDSLVVLVRDLPVISLNDPNDRCVDGPDMSFAGTPLPSGMQFASLSSDAASGFTDNGNGTASLDISLAGPGIYTIDYFFTDEYGCSNTTSSTVEIYDLPTVSISDPGDACVDASAVALSASPAPGPGEFGVFTTSALAGLSDNGDGTASFDPFAAGVGSYTITYTYTDFSGCINSATTNITINDLPSVTINDPADDCLSGGAMLFSGTPVPGGGTFGSFSTNAPGGLSDNGDGTASLDLLQAGAGIHDVDYLYTDINGCQSSASTSVMIYDTLPYVDLMRGSVCGNAAFGSSVIDLNTLIISGPAGGSWADTDGTGSLVGSVFTANSLMQGNSYVFTYTISGVGPVGSPCETRSFDVVVDVIYCYLDLALIKTSSQALPVLPNDMVTYEITICNQGFTAVDSIEVTEYIAPCYGFSPNNNWITSGPNASLTLTTANGLLPAGGLPPVTSPPNNCITVDLDLSILCGIPSDLICYTEITGSRDVGGNTGDFDSTAGSDSPAERSVLPGDPFDDSFSDPAEDDHDPATMPLADVALQTSVVTAGPYDYGQAVEFLIQVYNQGNIDLYDLEITDYIPCGFSLDPVLNPLWLDMGSTATQTISQLNVGQNTSISIFLNILESPAMCTNSTSWLNEVEVSALFNASMQDISLRDYDSRSNSIQGDDAGGAAGTASDNSILGDGSGAPGDTSASTDEDDHDPALLDVYDLAITKIVTSSPPYAQDSVVSYQLIIENQGGLDAAGIEIVDTPEIGLNFIGSDAGANPNVTEPMANSWTIGALAAGATETINIVYQIASGFQDLNLDNDVEIVSDDGDDIDSDPSTSFNIDEDGDGDGDDDDEDSVSIMVEQYYDLSINKTEISAGPYVQGSTISYEITVVNEGTLSASGIVIEDSPESGLSLVTDNSGTNPNVNALGSGIYEIINLPFGTSESFQVTYVLDNAYQGFTIYNRVQIILDDGDDIDSDPMFGYTVDEDSDLDPFDDDEDEVILDVFQTYDLSITKTELSSGPYYPGDVISFRLTVNNEGSLNASNIELEDVPDLDLSFVGDNINANSNVNSIAPLNYQILSLPFGTSESIDLSFQVDPVFQGDTVINATQILVDDGDDIDSDPAFDETVDEDGDMDGDDDDEDLLAIEIQQIYDLSVTKTLITGGDIYPGDPITFRIDIVNEGTLHANDIDITEAPDPNLIYLSNTTSADPNITEVSPNLFTISSLPAYSSTSFEISYTIDIDYLSPEISNIVRISRDDGDDIDSDPAFDETVDEDGDGNGFDDDEDEEIVGLFVGFLIGDYVWHDLDGDGLQDLGEPGLPEVRVELYNRLGFIVAWTLTDASGYYSFEEVFPGDYYIRVILEEDYSVTRDRVGSDTTVDSDLTEEYGPGTSDLYSLSADDLSIDAGLIRCANIGGTVWFDYNENDIEDPTENGINGMVVELYKYEPYGWTLWETTLTGHNENTPSDDGYYKFCAEPGRYYLRFLNPPESLVPALPGRGPEDVDSDVTGSFGQGTTSDFVIESGGEMCDIGAGYYVMGSIGDYIWHDTNGDGQRNSNESGMQGVVVNAINSFGDIIATAVSDSEGKYALEYLGKDEYFVQVIEPVGYSMSVSNVGSDESIDSDINGANGYGTSEYYSVSPGEHIANVDIGLVSASVLPVEWLDVRGEAFDGFNMIEWTVASELNVAHYVLERAPMESFDFQIIAEIPYSQSLDVINVYAQKDFDLEEGVDRYQYRVRQVDYNGSHSYSRIISILNRSDVHSTVDVKAFPNPAVDHIDLEIKIEGKKTDLELELIDQLGRRIYRNLIKKETMVLDDWNRIRLDLNSFAEGIYFIRIQNDDHKEVRRIMKSK